MSNESGYMGKPDAMRSAAEKILGNPRGGSAKPSNPPGEKMATYKTGGHVKSMTERDAKKCRQGGYLNDSDSPIKRAMGGVGKIRHDEATKDGMPAGYKLFPRNKVGRHPGK